MMPKLVTAAIVDVCAASSDALSRASREERLAAIAEKHGEGWAPELAEWFATSDDMTFMVDVRGAYLYATDGIWPDDDGLLVALGRHIAGDLTDVIDGLGPEFFEKGADGREAAVADALGGDTAFTRALRSTLSAATYHELAEGFRPYLAKCGVSGRLVVRTAAPLEASALREVRSALREKYPEGFAAFYVDRGLGGGMRLFADGTLVDASWTAEIDRVFSSALN